MHLVYAAVGLAGLQHVQGVVVQVVADDHLADAAVLDARVGHLLREVPEPAQHLQVCSCSCKDWVLMQCRVSRCCRDCVDSARLIVLSWMLDSLGRMYRHPNDVAAWLIATGRCSWPHLPVVLHPLGFVGQGQPRRVTGAAAHLHLSPGIRGAAQVLQGLPSPSAVSCHLAAMELGEHPGLQMLPCWALASVGQQVMRAQALW